MEVHSRGKISTHQRDELIQNGIKWMKTNPNENSYSAECGDAIILIIRIFNDEGEAAGQLKIIDGKVMRSGTFNIEDHYTIKRIKR